MIKQAVFAFLCIAASPLSVLADGEEPVVDEPVQRLKRTNTSGAAS